MSIILWILGLLGISIPVALGVGVFVFGLPAAYVIAKGLDLLKAVVAWFGTPLGQAVGVILLCLLVWSVADSRRHRLDEATWDARVKAAEAARLKWEADIRQKTDADADARVATIQQEKTDLEKQYEQNLPGGLACRRVNRNDVERVRDKTKR